jgi:hypothetical protein
MLSVQTKDPLKKKKKKKKKRIKTNKNKQTNTFFFLFTSCQGPLDRGCDKNIFFMGMVFMAHAPPSSAFPVPHETETHQDTNQKHQP